MIATKHADFFTNGHNGQGCIVVKDSTGTVRAWKSWFDDGKQCGDYTVSSKDNGAHVPTLMAQEIARKNPNDPQKAADTVQKFDALWAKYQMSNQNAQEESKE